MTRHLFFYRLLTKARVPPLPPAAHQQAMGSKPNSKRTENMEENNKKRQTSVSFPKVHNNVQIQNKKRGKTNTYCKCKNHK